MGRSRYDIDRATKIAEILEQAEAGFVADGYDAVSVAGTARAVGLAPNAVSWYFPTKDDLFVAVLERALDRSLHALNDIPANMEATDRTAVDWIIWVADRLHATRRLAIDLHQRMTVSEKAAAFHDRLHRELGDLLARGLRGRVAAEDIDTVVALVSTTLEGQLLHPSPAQERHDLIRSILSRYGVTGTPVS